MNVISPKIPSGVSHGRIPPGPRGNAITGNAIGLQHNILDFVTKIHELYGSPARVRLLPNYYGYLLSDPSDYQHVLQENSQVYAKEEIGRASCREECRSRWSPYH